MVHGKFRRLQVPESSQKRIRLPNVERESTGGRGESASNSREVVVQKGCTDLKKRRRKWKAKKTDGQRQQPEEKKKRK